MVNIRLDFKEEDYKDGIADIKVKKEICKEHTSFIKFTHTIKYSSKYDTWSWTWWWSSSSYYLYFKLNNSKPLFRYYTSEPKHIVDIVDVFYSKDRNEEPLVIGFKRDDTDDYQYYTYNYLKGQKWSYGLPPKEGNTFDTLDQKLKEGINSLDKKVTFKIGDGKNENILEHTADVGLGNKFKKKSFSTLTNTRPPWRVYSDNLLKSFPSPKIGYSVFDDVKGSGFEGIYVYYTKNNIPLAIEFSNGFKATRYIRKDNEGKHWEKKSYSSFDERTLDAIKNEYEQWITYHLEILRSSYANNKIDVIKKDERSEGYTVYEHIPKNSSDLRVTDVFYNLTKITIVQNKTIVRHEDVLKSLNDCVFKKIYMYSLNIGKNGHLLMKLTNKNNKVYFLHRIDNDTIKWKQLSIDDLLDINVINKGIMDEIGSRSLNEDMSNRISKAINENKSREIKTLLKDILVCINSIVVITQSMTTYGKQRINEILGEDGIRPIDIESNLVTVQDSSYEDFTACAKIDKYKLYIHRLLQAGQEAEPKLNSSPLYIRLYSGKNRIILFDDDKGEGPITYLEYSGNDTDLYVYLDKEKHIPLLFIYNNKIYRPKDKDSKGWIRLKDILDCSDSNKQALTKKIDEITRILNLSKTLDSPTTTSESNLEQNTEIHRPQSRDNNLHQPQHTSSGNGLTNHKSPGNPSTRSQENVTPSSVDPGGQTSDGKSPSKTGETSDHNTDPNVDGGKQNTLQKRLDSETHQDDSRIEGSDGDTSHNNTTDYHNCENGSHNKCNDFIDCLPHYADKHQGPFFGTVSAMGVVLLTSTGVSGYFIRRRCCRPKQVL